MKSERSRHDSDGKTTTTKAKEAAGHRRHRPRPTPKWLLEKNEMNEIAQRRCLLVLDVLSGTTPVTDAITAANVSRGTYYKWEERAVHAMMAALSPVVGPDGTEGAALDTALAKAAELESKLASVEKEQRRTSRMSLAIRKLVKPGPLSLGTGWPRGRRRRSKSASGGSGSSPISKGSPTPSAASETTATASTPTATGANGR